mgnify:CR=1 FL=1
MELSPSPPPPPVELGAPVPPRCAQCGDPLDGPWRALDDAPARPLCRECALTGVPHTD